MPITCKCKVIPCLLTNWADNRSHKNTPVAANIAGAGVMEPENT